jgi:hypothetical protein
MSNFVNVFIKDHKEYFLRNKNIIENNKWNNIESYKDKLESFSELILSVKDSKTKDKDKQIKEIEKDIKSFLTISAKNKKSLFEQENKLTTSILGRLTDFINEASEDRHLKKTQDFIDFTVDIINTHIKKCNEYLRYNQEVINKEDLTEDEIEFNDLEIVFQDDIFNKKISIQATLSKLNINNTSDNLQIKFFKDQKATIPMIGVFKNNQNYPEIRDITRALNLPTSTKDTSFYIHKNTKEIPNWNHKKHYWEQDRDVLDFWWNEYLKISQGVIIDGYHIHPWLYFHLNFFKTAIPIDGKIPIINPPLRDNELYFSELLKAREIKKNVGILIYGSRRISKSTNIASIADWKRITLENAVCTISSGSDSDIIDLGNKIKESMSNMVTAFNVPIQKQEWSSGDVDIGIKDGNILIQQSKYKIKNLEAGAAKKSQTTAGGASDFFVIEEIGKVPWEKAYLAAQPSFETPEGYRTIPLLIGTSGESSLSKDSLKAVSNPSSMKLMEMDWDLLEKYIPQEAITWERTTFASFMPAQMAYKTGFKRIKMGLGEYLGINSQELNKIEILKTDWINNTKVLLEDRARLKGDSLKLQQEIVQYPIRPSDCFLSSEKNIFHYEEAVRRREYLEQTGEWDRRFDLYRDNDGKIKKKPSNKPLAEYPHKGGNIDAPFLIFEDFPEEKQSLYTYIAGGDFYKQENSDTDSVGTIYIYKYDILGDKWAYRLVASYASRPDTFNEFYKNSLMLLEAYNAVFFPENEDLGGFQSFLEKQHLEDYYLMPHIDFNSTLEFSVNGRRRYGWTPAQSKRKLLNMYANYTKEDVKIINEEGVEIIMERIHTINDIYLLDEIINYNKDANVDRITASMGAIGFIHYLEKNFIHPKRFISQKNIEKKITERERNPYSSNTVRQKNPYSRR